LLALIGEGIAAEDSRFFECRFLQLVTVSASLRFPANSLGVRVDIKGLAAKEADQGLVAFQSEFDSKARRSRNCGDYRDAGGKSFLDDFEGRATANEQNM